MIGAALPLAFAALMTETSAATVTATATATAYADVHYAYSNDRPDDGELPGYLYNHARSEEVALNLGMLRLDGGNDHVRGALALQFGTYVPDDVRAWRVDARAFHPAAPESYIVVTTGLAVRFGGGVR